MNDSADMKQVTLTEASLALQTAIAALEKSLDPVLGKLSHLETKARESEAFSEDRTRLARELDDALEARQKRETEFERLSQQTRKELDLTIRTLQDVLGQSGQEG